jgi:hypothetical protein
MKWNKQSVTFTSDLHFQFGDSALKSEQLLLKGSLFSFEGGDLLLDATVLCLLEIEVSLPE